VDDVEVVLWVSEMLAEVCDIGEPKFHTAAEADVENSLNRLIIPLRHFSEVGLCHSRLHRKMSGFFGLFGSKKKEEKQATPPP
jgi:hypothetical protein